MRDRKIVTHFGEAFRVHVDAPRASESELEEGEICACRREEGENIRAFTSVRERRTKS